MNSCSTCHLGFGRRRNEFRHAKAGKCQEMKPRSVYILPVVVDKKYTCVTLDSSLNAVYWSIPNVSHHGPGYMTG